MHSRMVFWRGDSNAVVETATGTDAVVFVPKAAFMLPGVVVAVVVTATG